MNPISIEDKDYQAIEKKELDEYERRRLRGRGYDLMTVRDRGWARLHNDRVEGKDVVIEWHVEDKDEDRNRNSEGIYIVPRKLPEDKFILRIGKEEALIDKESFQKMFRWV